MLRLTMDANVKSITVVQAPAPPTVTELNHKAVWGFASLRRDSTTRMGRQVKVTVKHSIQSELLEYSAAICYREAP